MSSLPPRVRAAVAGATLLPFRPEERILSRVWTVTRDGAVVAYLKQGEDLAAERDRLSWLARQPVAVPRVLAFDTNADGEFLLTSALEGVTLDSGEVAPGDAASELGAALRRFHALAVDACPFDMSLDVTMSDAERHVRDGSVLEELFDPDLVGTTPAELLERLRALRPAEEERVVTHGDAHPANFLHRSDGDIAYVDVGRAGISDRYRDLAVAARYFETEFGAPLARRFFAAYGLADVDRARLRFYAMLDCFF